jgi:tripartite-type tricarboxylate transporter receptor subunit TctC
MAWLRRVGLVVLVLAAWGQRAGAQDYPTRPVSIAVPYAAGGGVDVVTRLVAQKLSERLGQAFVIDNRLGAGGLIASSYVAKAAPDGHTLLLGTDAQLAAQVTLRKSLPYDPTRDFVPVALVGNTPFGLIVSSSLPAQSVTDLIRRAKEHP